MANILAILKPKEVNQVSVYRDRDCFGFSGKYIEENKKYYIPKEDHAFNDIKNYVALLGLQNSRFIVHIDNELIRHDRFCFDKKYKDNVKKISFWEIIKKYNCDVEDIAVAQKINNEKDNIVVDCYVLKKELLNELKVIFEKQFYKILMICPEGEDEVNFLKPNYQIFNDLNYYILILLFISLLVMSAGKSILNNKNKDMLMNKTNISNMEQNNLTKEIIKKIRKADKNTENIILSIKKLSNLISKNTWIKEYSYIDGVEKIKGLINGDSNVLLNRIKNEYAQNLIEIESIKDEGNSLSSFDINITKNKKYD